MPGPSKLAEAIVGFFLPAARRDEVLGDLHERYRSPAQYAWDAVRAVPFVIVSRISRTSDAQLLLIEALVFYGVLIGLAWLWDRDLLRSPWGLVRLAVLVALVTCASALQGAYARPEVRLVRGPMAWLKRTVPLNRYLILVLAVLVLVLTQIWTANAHH